MKAATLLTTLAVLQLAHTTFAATHSVLPGESIQAKVNLAQPGDIVAIFGGTYPGDVVINKAIRLVEVDGQEVEITGNVTWTGVTDAPPFEGFTVGSAGKGITVNDTTGLVIKNVVSNAGTGVTSNGNSKISIVGGQYPAITQGGGELAVWDATVAGAFNASAGSQKTAAVRCVFNTGNWNTLRGYLGYCYDLLTFTHSGSNGKMVIIGCRFDRQHHYVDTINIQGSNNDVLISNCVITNARWGHWNDRNVAFDYIIHNAARGILVAQGGNRSLIFNNYITVVKYTWGWVYTEFGSSAGCGIRVFDATSKIYNNIIADSNYGISAPYGVDVSNNIIYSPRGGAGREGVILKNAITQAPAFVASSDYVLQAGSPGVNGGVDDPIFNDLDGSRNDVGIWGGCLFDPEARTTNKPIVISFDLAPQQLLKGVDTEVTISDGQAVAQP